MQISAFRWQFIAIFLWMVISPPGFSQEERSPFRYISATAYWGSLEIHSQKIEHFRGARPFGVDIDWSWRFVSEKAYALCQCYPSMGLTLNYRDFGNRSLGKGVSALFYVEPQLFTTPIVNLSLRAGLGLSYLSNPYDEETNPLNLTYSTRFAFPLMIGVVANRPLGNGWALNVLGTFQHISNGGTSQPNLGINYGALGVGIQKKLDKRPLPPPLSLEPFDPRAGIRDFQTGMVTGFKEPEDGDGSHLVLSLFGEYVRQFARINAWSAGVMAELDGSRQTSAGFNRSRYSATAGHRFLLGRFSFGQTAGLYLWSGHATKAPWYQYYTLDFKATGVLGFGVGLKAHGKVAEFLGVRVFIKMMEVGRRQ